MNNKEKSVGTTAEKSTTVETQHPSSHSNGNTHVVRSPKFVENNIKEKKKNVWRREMTNATGEEVRVPAS